MTYTATLGIAQTIELTVTTLLAMPAITVFCGSFTPITRIMLGDGGTDLERISGWDRGVVEYLPPLVIVGASQSEDRMPGLGSWREEGAITLDLFHQAVAGDRPADGYLRALDQLEALVDGFRDAARLGTLLANGVRIVDFPGRCRPDLPKAWAGSWHSQFALTFSRGIAP